MRYKTRNLLKNFNVSVSSADVFYEKPRFVRRVWGKIKCPVIYPNLLGMTAN